MKKYKRTDYAKFESIMAKLDNKLKKIAEQNKKEKKNRNYDEDDDE